MPRELISRPTTVACPDTDVVREIDAVTRALRTATAADTIRALRVQLEELRERYQAAAAAGCR